MSLIDCLELFQLLTQLFVLVSMLLNLNKLPLAEQIS